MIVMMPQTKTHLNGVERGDESRLTGGLDNVELVEVRPIWWVYCRNVLDGLVVRVQHDAVTHTRLLARRRRACADPHSQILLTLPRLVVQIVAATESGIGPHELAGGFIDRWARLGDSGPSGTRQEKGCIIGVVEMRL